MNLLLLTSIQSVSVTSVLPGMSLYCFLSRYGEFLKEVVRNQLNLTAIADKIDQHAFKRSSKTREGTVLKDRMFEDDEHCLISSTFFTKLKLQLRARRRLLGCPQRCDLPLYLHCSEELDPTNYILCVSSQFLYNM